MEYIERARSHIQENKYLTVIIIIGVLLVAGLLLGAIVLDTGDTDAPSDSVNTTGAEDSVDITETEKGIELEPGENPFTVTVGEDEEEKEVFVDEEPVIIEWSDIPEDVDITIQYSESEESTTYTPRSYNLEIDGPEQILTVGEEAVFELVEADGNIDDADSVEWSIADEEIGTDVELEYVFEDAGTYTVRGYAEFEQGSHAVTERVTVEKEAEPSLQLNGPSQVELNEAVQFDASVTGATADSYSWGVSGAEYSEGHIEHTFDEVGTSTVKVTVETEGGETLEESIDVTVSEETHTVEFYVTDDSTGDDLEEASIEVYEDSEYLVVSGTTGADGTFDTSLGEGSYSADINKDGYRDHKRSFSVDSEMTESVSLTELSDDESDDDESDESEATGMVSVNPSIEGALVELVHDGEVIDSDETDEDGEYTVGGENFSDSKIIVNVEDNIEVDGMPFYASAVRDTDNSGQIDFTFAESGDNVETVEIDGENVVVSYDIEEEEFDEKPVANIYQLQTLKETNLNSDYRLVRDIDASVTGDWENENKTGFEPIGEWSDGFEGSLDGQEYEIINLTIDSPQEQDVGLFGVLEPSSEVSDLSINNTDIIGSEYVGGVAGWSSGATIDNTSVTGDVVGEDSVGGIIGYNFNGEVRHSDTDVSVSGTSGVGGLLGVNDGGSIDKSFATGDVSGEDKVGGIVGTNQVNSMTEVFSTGDVDGEEQVGGLIGGLHDSEVKFAYSTGNVIGESQVGGLVGNETGADEVNSAFAAGEISGTDSDTTGGVVGTSNTPDAFTNVYWDTESTGVDSSDAGSPLTTEDMTGQANEWDKLGELNFQTDWTISEDPEEYPQIRSLASESVDVERVIPVGSVNCAAVTYEGDGTDEIPYEIETIEQLQCIEMNSDAHYELVSDIDGSETSDWTDGEGFIPITEFGGVIDGNGHSVNDLTIESAEDDVGIFSQTTENTLIQDIEFESVSVTGDENVGGLVGYHKGTIYNIDINGTIEGETMVGGVTGTVHSGFIHGVSSDATVSGNVGVGGVTGVSEKGNFKYISADGDVEGDELIGGIIGDMEQNSNLNESVVTGPVYGDTDVGALVGGYDNNDEVVASYWDETDSGTTQTDGVGTGSGTMTDSTGITTEEMQGSEAENNMNGLDFVRAWDTQSDNTPVYREYATSHVRLIHMDGDGVSAPYVITNVHELQAMEANLGANYELGNDIDASEASDWNDGKGFEPIAESSGGFSATEFEGSLDGNEHTITGLDIQRPDTEYVGLFARTSSADISNLTIEDAHIESKGYTGVVAGRFDTSTSMITNVHISNTEVTDNRQEGYVGGVVGSFDGHMEDVTVDDVDIEGGIYTGGMVGRNYGSIDSVSTESGHITGRSRVGGIVGNNRGDITQSRSLATIEVSDSFGEIGGIAGGNSGVVSESYTDGVMDVESSSHVGGIVGRNFEEVRNTYSLTNMTVSNSSNVGTISGQSGTVLQSYSAGPITTENVDNDVEVVGTDTVTFATYYDLAVDGMSDSPPRSETKGLTTEEMQGTDVNTVDKMGGFDFQDTWTVKDAEYPELRAFAEETINVDPVKAVDEIDCQDVSYDGRGVLYDPYEISNVLELQCIAWPGNDNSANYKITDDIDATETEDWNDGYGFYPLGSQSNDAFSGYIEGQGHTIENIHIERPDALVLGLFSYMDDGRVHTLNVEDIHIHGGSEESEYSGRVGGLVGRIGGDGGIDGVTVTGAIEGHSRVGGVVGSTYNFRGSIENTEFHGNVNGDNRVGGLIGDSRIEDMHGVTSSGTVTGNTQVGGLIGRAFPSGEQVPSELYTSADVVGEEDVGGVIGRAYSGEITDVYATGEVQGETSVGGVLGRAGDWWGDTIKLSNTYATGSVKGTDEVGGVVGKVTSNGVIEDSYWDTTDTGTGQDDAVGQNDGSTDNIIGLTTEEMKGDDAESNMEALDFTETWITVTEDTPRFDGPYELTATVIDEQGTEISEGYVIRGDTRASDQARFLVEDGDYTVRYKSETYKDTEKSITINEEDKDIELTTKEVPRLTVDVEDLDGNPAPGDITVNSHTVTDDTAEFGLDDGEYDIDYTSTDYEDTESTVTMDGEDKNRTLTVGEAHELTINLENMNGETIHGDVTIEGETRTGSSIDFNLPDGEYTVEFDADMHRMGAEDVEISGTDKEITIQSESITDYSVSTPHVFEGSYILSLDGKDSLIYVGLQNDDWEGEIRAYDIESDEVVYSHIFEDGPANVRELSVTENSHISLRGWGGDSQVDAVSNSPRADSWTFEDEERGVYSIAQTDDSVFVGAGGAIYYNDGEPVVYKLDKETGEIRQDEDGEDWMFEGHSGEDGHLRGLDAGSDGDVYTAGRDGQVISIDGETGEENWSFALSEYDEYSDEIMAHRVLYHDGYVYSSWGGHWDTEYDATVRKVDAETGEPVSVDSEEWQHNDHDDMVSALHVHDGVLYTGTSYTENDSTVQSVDIETGERTGVALDVSTGLDGTHLYNGSAYFGETWNEPLYRVDIEE